MIRPLQQDAALLHDINTAPADGRLHGWWLGQSGFLLKWQQYRFLLDPYLSDTLTHKYAATDKPHVRMTERSVDPALLTDLTLVTASHLHTDHLDAGTLQPLARANPGLPFFLPAAILADAQNRLGDAALTYHPLCHAQCYTDTSGDWSIEGIAAAHNELTTDAQGRHHYLGFILRCGPYTIYHSGDTLWHSGLVPALAPLDCDLMLLPINGNKPERRVAGNLNGTEAAALARACNARLVIPCHYDMFTFNTATPDEFVATCTRLGQPHQVLQCGERVSLG